MPSLAMKQTGHCVQILPQESGADVIGQSIADPFEATQGGRTGWPRHSIPTGWFCLPIANAGGALKRVLDAEILAETIDGGHYEGNSKYSRYENRVAKLIEIVG